MIITDLPEESEILDLAMAKNDLMVNIKLARSLIEPLERIGQSWQCENFSETIDKMLNSIENGDSPHHATLGNETRKLIRMHLDAGRQLPAICARLNKNGYQAQDGGVWTTKKLSIYCKYHGIEYRHVP